jgi:hypothetical protein
MEIIQNIERIYHNYEDEFSNNELINQRIPIELELILSYIDANLNNSLNLFGSNSPQLAVE